MTTLGAADRRPDTVGLAGNQTVLRSGPECSLSERGSDQRGAVVDAEVGCPLAGRRPKPNRAAADAASGPRLRRDPETFIKSSIDSIENLEGNQ